MSGKYALIIANTDYSDPGLAKLSAPGRDAEELARVLRSSEIAAFDEVKVLLNETEPNVREAIDDFFSLKKNDDLLLLYFSGHGVRDEAGALYLAVKNTNRMRLRSTAVKSDFIRESMDQSRSKRQVLILDCCNSGAFAQGTKAEIGGSMGTASAFEGTGFGRVILTASDSTQFAWEGDQVIGNTDNSLFTHYLVSGLEGEADIDSDGRITVDELYDYAYEKIVSQTPKQTPGKWSYKQQGEIVLRQNIRPDSVKPVTLPDDLIEEMGDSRTYVREAAVQKLEKIMKGKNLGMARSAREALEKIAAEDDSRHISQVALQALEQVHEAERLVREQTEALIVQKADKEHIERERVEEEDKEKEEMEHRIRERLESEWKAQEDTKHISTVQHPKWILALWVALSCAIGSGIGFSLAATIGLDYYNSSGSSAGFILFALAGGAICGFGIAIALQRELLSPKWQYIFLFTLWFALSSGLGETIGDLINRATDNSNSLISYAIGWGINGALWGLSVAVILKQKEAIREWKKVIWIGISFAIGLAVNEIIYFSIATAMNWSINSAMSFAMTIMTSGMVGGAICGIGLLWQAQKERIKTAPTI